MNKVTYCNINLDRKAVGFLNAKPGMVVARAGSAGIHIIDSVGRFSVTLATGEVIRPRHPQAGTFVWLDAPASYNYHAGHGCAKDN